MKTTETDKLWVAIDEIAPNPDQPRKYFDEEALKRTADSLRRRQNQPLTVIPWSGSKDKKVRWMIVDGERRWRAARAAGLKRLWIVIDADVKTDQELHEASFAANWCREGHTHKETAEAIDLLVKRGKTYLEIGVMVGKSESWAKKEHALLNLHDDILKLIDAPTPKGERIPSAVAYALTAYPAAKQKALWAKHKAQGSAAFHHIRTAAPRQSTRSRGDDVRYIKAQSSQAQGILQRLQELPATMLRSLTHEDRTAVAERLRDAAKKAEAFAALLVAAQDDDGED